MHYFWDVLRAYPARSALMLGALFLSLLVEGLGLSTLLMMLLVVAGDESEKPSQLEDAVRSGLDALGIDPAIGNLVVIFVAVMTLQAGVMLLTKRQVAITKARIATDLRLLLIRSLAAARWSFFTSQPSGSVAASITSEARRASEHYFAGATLIMTIAQALLYGTVALMLSWQVSVASLLAAGIAMLAARRFVAISRKIGRESTELRRELLRHVTDGLQALKPLKAMARETRMGPLLERDTKKINKLVRRKVMANQTPTAIQQPLNASFAALGIFVAVTYWKVPVAEMGVLLVLFANTVRKLTRTQRVYQGMAGLEDAIRALRSTIERAQDSREFTHGGREPTLEEAVSLEGISVRYGDHLVFEDVSLEIPAGQITAVVGPSGAGKTTLVDIVCGLIQPAAGKLRVDSVDLDDIDLRAWRRTIGYVPQEVFLINDTVRENVTLGEKMKDSAVESALRRAGAWSFVSTLEDGIQTVVGERGSRLSGGQRQRICIARAMVHEPRLLILDEATTALDPATEAQIWDAILELDGQVTVLAVSHQARLMSVASRIYKVEAGRVQRVDPTDLPGRQRAGRAQE